MALMIEERHLKSLGTYLGPLIGSPTMTYLNKFRPDVAHDYLKHVLSGRHIMTASLDYGDEYLDQLFRDHWLLFNVGSTQNIFEQLRPVKAALKAWNMYWKSRGQENAMPMTGIVTQHVTIEFDECGEDELQVFRSTMDELCRVMIEFPRGLLIGVRYVLSSEFEMVYYPLADHKRMRIVGELLILGLDIQFKARVAADKDYGLLKIIFDGDEGDDDFQRTRRDDAWKVALTSLKGYTGLICDRMEKFQVAAGALIDGENP